ncbi:DNA recombination protein RmuC [Mycoplasma sp. ATU-Cv-703]|uniref:DNA recombination protein RmuC n=1 Tax=Mycoplasma sp. ATU-Cv-703 TaxID=2498595 RepID=UPI000FDEF81F
MQEFLTVILVVFLIVLVVGIGLSLYLYRLRERSRSVGDIGATREHQLQSFNTRIEELRFQLTLLMSGVENTKLDEDEIVKLISPAHSDHQRETFPLREMLEAVLGGDKTYYVWQYADAENSFDAMLYGVRDQKNNIIIDSKAPLDLYHKAFVLPNKEKRHEQLKVFIDKLQTYLRSVKSFLDVDHVAPFMLVYLPSESVFNYLKRRQPELISAAREQGVHLVGPIQLFLALLLFKKMKTKVQGDKLYDEIAQLKQDFANFASRWDKLNRRLRQFSQEFDQVKSSF